MAQDESKRKAAEAALPYIKDVEILGVGTGSTVNHFIDCLADFNLTNDIKGAVSSSIATTERLKKIGIPVMELSESGNLDVYVDGADEVNPLKELIKGGGGALTREKIIAGASEKFVCIVDESKTVKVLGEFPLPIEVIPMARSYVAREIVKLGGQPIWRENYLTDNGCEIIDVHNMEIAEPLALERLVNNIAGVVTVGIFGVRPADVVLIAKESGVETM
ncbi:ribose 5-phosphate isomerase A [Bathymodiolus japonicus methanotrophic gill symbiont]|uniref:ribose-5-phosphate isomerase RpiA n=1 Tax=Bathymodiolus japonicus methanotrophic gill symbiont TaxID=113269 RepID=UPI001B64A958|nr:ribose-5-phosphate isomerase RpiA [Bathymodiolus japonicus methanotrophic gill symbiont]GFO71339.1 ribose 5-phosphate isomerase A [Bathymodiolus japonicus methanotrophic gill symbiont]